MGLYTLPGWWPRRITRSVVEVLLPAFDDQLELLKTRMATLKDKMISCFMPFSGGEELMEALSEIFERIYGIEGRMSSVGL